MTAFASATSFPEPKETSEREVIKALEGQIAAWNAGDLEAAMAFYWNSPDILWINKTGIERGYQEVLEMFRQDFTDSSNMGVYSYEPLHIEQVTPEAVFFVFQWKIVLRGKRLMGGVSSQLWKKLGGSWVVTCEHAS